MLAGFLPRGGVIRMSHADSIGRADIYTTPFGAGDDPATFVSSCGTERGNKRAIFPEGISRPGVFLHLRYCVE